MPSACIDRRRRCTWFKSERRVDSATKFSPLARPCIPLGAHILSCSFHLVPRSLRFYARAAIIVGRDLHDWLAPPFLNGACQVQACPRWVPNSAQSSCSHQFPPFVFIDEQDMSSSGRWDVRQRLEHWLRMAIDKRFGDVQSMRDQSVYRKHIIRHCAQNQGAWAYLWTSRNPSLQRKALGSPQRPWYETHLDRALNRNAADGFWERRWSRELCCKHSAQWILALFRGRLHEEAPDSGCQKHCGNSGLRILPAHTDMVHCYGIFQKTNARYLGGNRALIVCSQ